MPAQARTGGAVSFPSYCRADGVMDPRTGAEAKHYAIGFAVVLPDNWNGRFLFQGRGALNVIQQPLASNPLVQYQRWPEALPLSQPTGGHQASPFDTSFFRDQEASLNFPMPRRVRW